MLAGSTCGVWAWMVGLGLLVEVSSVATAAAPTPPRASAPAASAAMVFPPKMSLPASDVELDPPVAAILVVDDVNAV